MSKKTKFVLALICVVCLSASSLNAFAYSGETGSMDEGASVGEISGEGVPVAGFTASEIASEKVSQEDDEGVPIYINGQLECLGYMHEGTTYVPIRVFSLLLDSGAEVIWDSEECLVTIKSEGLELTYDFGDSYMVANDRYLYMYYGSVNVDGILYVPIRELCKAFGAKLEWNVGDCTVSINTEDMTPIQSGDEYYIADDVYWLSRVINAEARNQQLAGMIGVGNVVLNRVEYPSCPDTIYDVIFDTKFGVQFSVIISGSIYNTPSDDSAIAAKIALEGYETVGDSLYFVNPIIGNTDWFASTRTFVVSIGDHDFYA